MIVPRALKAAPTYVPLPSTVDVVPNGNRVVLHITWRASNEKGLQSRSHSVRVIVGGEALDRYRAMTMQGR